MTIGGGTFTVHNKVLPGAYINVVSARAGATMGTRGVASLPLALSWGEENKIIRVEAADFAKNSLKLFGYDAAAPEMLSIREVFKHAKTMLVYRYNTGTKATKAFGALTATAKYNGKCGNNIRVAVLASGTETKFDVVTYYNGVEVDKQTALGTVQEVKANDFVTFSGTGPLTAQAAANLASGTDTLPELNQAITKYLTALELEEFNAVGIMTGNKALTDLFVAFTKRMREDEGKKIVCVLPGVQADYEGVVSVKNGVLLEDGTVLNNINVVAWVVGAMAGAESNESLTNVVYEGAVDVDVRMTKTQYEEMIKGGYFVFYYDGEKARVLSDINSLTTFANKSADMSSNRVVRVLDSWANDIARIFSQTYIGAITNDDTGRQLFRADLVGLALQYQSIGAISNFTSEDIEVLQGTGKRDVVVNCALQPNDSMEKLYMTVNVS